MAFIAGHPCVQRGPQSDSRRLGIGNTAQVTGAVSDRTAEFGFVGERSTLRSLASWWRAMTPHLRLT
jgi:hypothetical protein